MDIDDYKLRSSLFFLVAGIYYDIIIYAAFKK